MKKWIGVALLALSGTMVLMAADVTGKWTGEMEGRDGNKRQIVFNLKVDDGQLTGTAGGGRGEPAAIQNGKVDGDNMSFDVTRTFGDRTFTMHYTGKLDGEKLNLTITTPNGTERQMVLTKSAD